MNLVHYFMFSNKTFLHSTRHPEKPIDTYKLTDYDLDLVCFYEGFTVAKIKIMDGEDILMESDIFGGNMVLTETNRVKLLLKIKS